MDQWWINGVDQQSMGSPISRPVRRIRVKMRPLCFSVTKFEAKSNHVHSNHVFPLPFP